MTLTEFGQSKKSSRKLQEILKNQACFSIVVFSPYPRLKPGVSPPDSLNIRAWIKAAAPRNIGSKKCAESFKKVQRTGI
jgi:hypothetical protein